MAFTVVLYLVVCLLSAVNADCGKNSTTSTISNADDASALSSCTVFSGSLAIATDVAGDVDIPGVQEILGDLLIRDTLNVTSVSASKLRRLDGTFNVENATAISALKFPALTEAGAIAFFGLANLADFDFTAGITSVSKVDIERTFLNSLDGLNLLNADVLLIANNQALETIDLPLQSISGNLTVEANGQNCTLSLGNLTSAGNLWIQDMLGLSLPSLTFLSGDFLLSNNLMSKLVFKDLNVIKGYLSLRQNPGLQDVSFPALLSVGGELFVDGNVTTLDLEQTSSTGPMNISGPLETLTVPALKMVNGPLTINSTSPRFSCSYLFYNVDSGTYNCQGGLRDSPTFPPDSGDSLSGQAIGGIVVGGLVALAAVGTGAYFLWKRRRASRRGDDTVGQQSQVNGDLLVEKDGEPFTYFKEMPTGDERHEVAEQHGFSETAGQPVYELPGNDEQNVPTTAGTSPTLADR